jgi:hypothetical protein
MAALPTVFRLLPCFVGNMTCNCNRYTKVYSGRATNDEEISGFLIATLFAGQHTSSITSSWTGYQMLDTKVST